jgi:hypothetical protein
VWCGLGATKAAANGMERAGVRHGVELYTPCSPMARQTVRWQSVGMEGRDATLAGARAIRRGVIRFGDAKLNSIGGWRCQGGRHPVRAPARPW